MKNLTTTNSIRRHPFLLAAILIGLSACGPKAAESTRDAIPGPLQSFLLTEAPENALSVATARKDPNPGEVITLTGQIGGTLRPLLDGHAGFVIADSSLMFCNKMPDPDHCETPWDACCEDPERVASHRAMVQILDEAGDILPYTLRGVKGLKELSFVTVTGEVAEGSHAGNLVINARRLFVHLD